MISKEHKCIFIHIQKTAGTSIERKLGHFTTLEREVQDHRTIKEIEALGNTGQHAKLSLYALSKGKPKLVTKNIQKAFKPELSRKEYNEFYKFTFVRNSWSRVYSWYANVMRDEKHRAAYNIEDENYSFQQFLEEKLNHKTFSQLHFLKDSKGKIPMDFIGRFENLQADFSKVCEHLGIEDSKLPELLVSGNKHYTEFYTEATKDLVYRYYKEEIEHFKFEYGA